jgi:hypothetical protein
MTMTPDELAELERANPIAAARYRTAHGIASTTPHEGDAAVRLARMRPAPAPAPEAPKLAELRARHAELEKTNPAAAARFAVAHRLFGG